MPKCTVGWDCSSQRGFMVFYREHDYDEHYIKRLREGDLGAQTNLPLYRSEGTMRAGHLEKRTQVGLKSSEFTGNWYLSLISFSEGLLLNSENENSQGKLDLRPLTNNSTIPDFCWSPQIQQLNGHFLHSDKGNNKPFLSFFSNSVLQLGLWDQNSLREKKPDKNVQKGENIKHKFHSHAWKPGPLWTNQHSFCFIFLVLGVFLCSYLGCGKMFQFGAVPEHCLPASFTMLQVTGVHGPPVNTEQQVEMHRQKTYVWIINKVALFKQKESSSVM